MLDQPDNIRAAFDDIMSYNDHYNIKHNSIREEEELRQIFAEIASFKTDLEERARARNSVTYATEYPAYKKKPQRRGSFGLFSRLLKRTRK
jgi:hypothetical protein